MGVTEREREKYITKNITSQATLLPTRGFDHGLTLATNHHCKPSQESHSFTGQVLHLLLRPVSLFASFVHVLSILVLSSYPCHPMYPILHVIIHGCIKFSRKSRPSQFSLSSQSHPFKKS